MSEDTLSAPCPNELGREAGTHARRARHAVPLRRWDARRSVCPFGVGATPCGCPSDMFSAPSPLVGEGWGEGDIRRNHGPIRMTSPEDFTPFVGS